MKAECVRNVDVYKEALYTPCNALHIPNVQSDIIDNNQPQYTNYSKKYLWNKYLTGRNEPDTECWYETLKFRLEIKDD